LNSPTNEPITGTGVSAHSVSLSWTPSTSTNVVTYNIYRVLSAGSSAPPTPYPNLGSISASTCSADLCSYTDSAVQAGQSYWYYATAVDNNNSESVPSNTAQATVPTP
jgi:fibronectin type 3 domain-containing protein